MFSGGTWLYSPMQSVLFFGTSVQLKCFMWQISSSLLFPSGEGIEDEGDSGLRLGWFGFGGFFSVGTIFINQCFLRVYVFTFHNNFSSFL